MSMQPKKPQLNQPFASFDFLRAIFSIVVVALHANLFNLFVGKPKLDFISDILNLNVGYLAVPVFLQISLFLFYLKNKKPGHEYFVQRRLPKLISLYLFWVGLKLVFDSFLKAKPVMNSFAIQSVWQLIEFIISGGHTIFYFFFSLLFVTFVADLFMAFMNRLETYSKRMISTYLLLGSSFILVFLLPVIDIIHGNEALANVIDPLSFLPYVFTTAIIFQEFNQGDLKAFTPSVTLKLVSLAALCLLLTVLEWYFFEGFPHSRLFPHYCRLSLVIASSLLLYLALLINRQVPAIVSLISHCSLGIYGFHIFFLDYMPPLGQFFRMSPAVVTFVQFAIALVGSIILTLIFKKINKLRSFV